MDIFIWCLHFKQTYVFNSFLFAVLYNVFFYMYYSLRLIKEMIDKVTELACMFFCMSNMEQISLYYAHRADMDLTW